MVNYSLVALLLIFTDILTKWLVKVFGFPYSRNYGLFFGFIEDRGNFSLILAVVSILAVLIFLSKNSTADKLFRISGTLFLSGAFGNFFTKLFLGYVVDFLPGGFFGHFFNLADIYLFLGLFGIIISEMRRTT